MVFDGTWFIKAMVSATLIDEVQAYDVTNCLFCFFMCSLAKILAARPLVEPGLSMRQPRQ